MISWPTRGSPAMSPVECGIIGLKALGGVANLQCLYWAPLRLWVWGISQNRKTPFQHKNRATVIFFCWHVSQKHLAFLFQQRECSVPGTLVCGPIPQGQRVRIQWGLHWDSGEKSWEIDSRWHRGGVRDVDATEKKLRKTGWKINSLKAWYDRNKSKRHWMWTILKTGDNIALQWPWNCENTNFWERKTTGCEFCADLRKLNNFRARTKKESGMCNSDWRDQETNISSNNHLRPSSLLSPACLEPTLWPFGLEAEQGNTQKSTWVSLKATHWLCVISRQNRHLLPSGFLQVILAQLWDDGLFSAKNQNYSLALSSFCLLSFLSSFLSANEQVISFTNFFSSKWEKAKTKLRRQCLFSIAVFLIKYWTFVLRFSPGSDWFVEVSIDSECPCVFAQRVLMFSVRRDNSRSV